MKRWHSDALRTAKSATDALTRIADQLDRLNDNLETMSDDDDDNPVDVPPEVHSQLEATRESFNMVTEIKHGLRELDFDEALEWVENHPEEYMEGVMHRGFAPADDGDDE